MIAMLFQTLPVQTAGLPPVGEGLVLVAEQRKRQRLRPFPYPLEREHQRTLTT